MRVEGFSRFGSSGEPGQHFAGRAARGRMAQSLDGADGLPTGRPESPLHLLEDETAPDDAGEAGAGRKRKGKSTRWNIPSSALSMLEQMFQKDKFPSVETRKKIATDLKVTPRQVQVWFQNKRQRSTKPPGRPSDTRSILNTSVSFAERPLLSLASDSPAAPFPLARCTPRTALLCAAHTGRFPPLCHPARPGLSLAPHSAPTCRVCSSTFIPACTSHLLPLIGGHPGRADKLRHRGDVRLRAARRGPHAWTAGGLRE